MKNTQETKKDRYPNDSRVTNNDNPSASPIKHTDDEKPDPFNPFKTGYLADGGDIVTDPIEAQFTEQLSKTITPESPSLPTQHEQSIRRETHAKEQRNSIDDSHTRVPQKGLIKEVSTTLSTIKENWEYHIQKEDTNTLFSHYGIKNNNIVFTIIPTNNAFTIAQYDTDITPMSRTREITVPDFPTAIAAFTEGIDWGVIPTQPTPQIWEYTGFDSTCTFEEYISGSNNIECGEHTFINTAAEYTITIESYADNRPNTNQETLTILSIMRTRHDTKQGLVYRNRFAGQKHAFDFMYSALDAGLSRIITLHEGKNGNTNAIPSIKFLTQTKS